MYIITNTCMGGEYTPSKAKTLKEAKKWLKFCTADNIVIWKGDEYEFLYNMSDKKVIKWAKENLNNFVFSEDGMHSEIHYGDSSYNVMNIYDLDKIHYKSAE